MQIDLNQPFTLEDIKELIASKDDSVHRQLRVTVDGAAFLSDVVGNIDTDGLAFSVETWSAGNGFVGEAAANDLAWVKKVEAILRENWPNPADTFIELV